MEIVLLYVSFLKTKDAGFLSGLWWVMSVFVSRGEVGASNEEYC